VATDADEVDSWIAEKVEFLAKPLSRVDMEVCRMAIENARDFVKWLNNPGFVVDVHDRDEHGVGAHGLGNFARVDQSTLIYADSRDGKALGLEMFDRLQDSLVFDLSRDDVSSVCGLSVGGETENGKVVGLSSPASEDDFIEVGCHDFCDVATSFLKCIAVTPKACVLLPELPNSSRM
jgi:hypothetical protein